MSELSLDTLRRDGEAFMQEISREYYLAYSGHKSSAELQPLYAKYAHVMSADALALTLDAFRATQPNTEERRSARLLLDWQAESQSGRELASLDEREIAWESSAVVRTKDGREVQYESVSIDIRNDDDPRQRHTLEQARASVVASEFAPMRRERFQREREITEKLELAPSYNATFELLSGIPLAALRAECEQFLRDTRDLWDDVLPRFAKRVLGMETRDLTRADALALFRARDFDAYFPGAKLEAGVQRQVREMGVDPLANGRVILDTAAREGKRARAFCSPVRVPDEVYLVLRPHGGQADWMTFLHELGHALHYAYMRPDLPFEYRWLGDNSITEAYAMLFDHRTKDAGWLKRYAEIPPAKLDDVVRSSGFEELHFLRRYCAKFIYEIDLYGGSVSWDALPDLYVEGLTAATTFRYDASDAFVDVDPRYYAARYLRAWQLQALIAETLVERYDVDWWRNPRAGPWICSSLFAEGQRELAHEQAARVANKGLSFAPLVRAVERMLA